MNDFHGVMLYLDKVDAEANSFSGVLIADESEEGSSRIIFAKEGRLSKLDEDRTMLLELAVGTIHLKTKERLAYRMVSFEKYEMTLDLLGEKQRSSTKISNEYQMTVGELIEEIQNSDMDDKSYFKVRFELHKRLAMSVSCLVFALIGMSLGIMPQLSSKAGGFSLSLLIFMLYYFLFATGEDMGRSGKAPIWLMAWMPNFTFGILGLYLFNLAAHEKAPTLLVWANRFKYYYRAKLNPKTKA